MRRRKLFFLTTAMVVFLDMLGISIVIPILAPLFLDPAGMLGSQTPDALRTVILGVLIAVFPLMQFFGAPILGALSDRHGRKNMLLISVLGTFVGYLLFAIGIMEGSLTMLFIGRMLDGFTGGNISVVLSSIADVSRDEDKAKNFGLIGMVFGLGFIIGPFIGGNLADPSLVSWFSYATPFWAAAILAGVNMLFIWFAFEETLKERRHTPVNLNTGWKNLQRAWSMRHLRLVFVIVFLLSFGFTFFTQFSQVFYIQKFSFTQSQIGNLFAYIGLWLAVTQGLLIRVVVRFWRPTRILQYSLPCLAIALVLVLFPQRAGYLYVINPLIAIFHGLSYPNLTALISNLSAKDSQGEILGLNQSIQAAAQIIPPLASGLIVTMHMNLPILISGVVMLIAWLVLLQYRRTEKRPIFHEV